MLLIRGSGGPFYPSFVLTFAFLIRSPVFCFEGGVGAPGMPPMHPGSWRVRVVQCSGRVQRYPCLFDVSRSLNVAVLNCSTRHIDLRAARCRSDLATHTPSWGALAGACG